MDIHRILIVLRRRAYIVVLSMLSAGLLLYAMNASKPPIYAAKTIFFLAQPIAPDQRPSYDTLLFNDRIIPTYAELIRSTPVMKDVINQLNLPLDDKTLLADTEIIVVRNTQLLQLQVENESAQTAADIANTIVRVFNQRQAAAQQAEIVERQRQLLDSLNAAQADTDRTRELLQAAQARNDAAETQRLSEMLVEYQGDYKRLNEQIALTQNAVTAFGLQLAVVEPAQPVTISVRTNTVILTGLGAIFGALFSVALVLAMELLNTRIRSYEDAAGVPKLRLLRPVLPLGLATSGVTASGAYRELCLQSSMSANDGPRTWLISGVMPGFDVSDMIVLLGITLAQAGQRVVLVDVKFDQPTLHSLFGQSNAAGLSTALQQERPMVRDYVLQLTDRNLLLLPTGPVALGVSGQLAARRFEAVVRQLQRDYDIVLFHTLAPAASVDAAVIGRLCDAALLFVQTGTTRKQVLQRAVEQLAAGGLNEMQMVLVKGRRRIPSVSSIRAWLEQRGTSLARPAAQPAAYPATQVSAPVYSAASPAYVEPQPIAGIDRVDSLDE